MIAVRRSEERGRFDHGWLDTRHTFSFADYHDDAHMGFRALRVINEDVVRPGQGFGKHGHRDMEIISYVLEGALAHEDSTGGRGTLRPGEVQRMTAGTGVMHSEFNGSGTDPVHFLQIWLLPDRRGRTPGYEQKTFPDGEKRAQLPLVASPDAEGGSLRLHQDARVFASLLARGEQVERAIAPGRHAWVQVARGEVDVNGTRLRQGDGAAISEERALRIAGAGDGLAELLLFDLA